MAAAAGVLYQYLLAFPFKRAPWKPCSGGENEGHIRNDVSASGNGLLARLAVPDSDRVASNSGLSAERAEVSCVLCDFHLLDLLTEGSTVSVGSEQSAPVLLSPSPYGRLR